MIEQLQQGVAPVSPAEIKAIWWTLTYVILPALGAGYLFTIGLGKFLHGSFTKRFDKLKENELAHVWKAIRHLQEKK